MRLDEIVENPDNPSVGTDEDMKRLEGKLTRVPDGLKAMRIAYVTDKIPGKKMVISGNKRLRMLKKMHGEDAELPDEFFQDVTSMSEAERHEFIVAANISDGHWDARKLLEQYSTGELANLMDDQALAKLISKTAYQVRAREEGTYTSEVLDKDNAKSLPGKVYKLGRHRLYVGDATLEDSYTKLLDRRYADMLLTDPPYGVNIVGQTEKNLTIANDDLHGDEFQKFLNDFCTNSFKKLKSGAAVYIWHGDGDVEHYFHDMSAKQKDFHISMPVIWVKNAPTFSMGRLHYNKQSEQCIYGWKEGAKCFWIGDTNQTTIVQDDSLDLDKMSDKELADLVRSQQSNALRFNKPSRSRLHPTMKPLELWMKLISNSSRVDETVLDPFAGSGTSFIACEELSRTCCGMELLPYYADVIRKRWAEHVYGEGCDWEACTPEEREEGIEAL